MNMIASDQHPARSLCQRSGDLRRSAGSNSHCLVGDPKHHLSILPFVCPLNRPETHQSPHCASRFSTGQVSFSEDSFERCSNRSRGAQSRLILICVAFQLLDFVFELGVFASTLPCSVPGLPHRIVTFAPLLSLSGADLLRKYRCFPS